MNSMKLSITILLFITFVTLTGCKRTSAPQTLTNSSNSPTTTSEQLNHPAGGTTPAADVKYFRGSIGNALGLQMKLTREGDKLWGTYFYQKVGTKIDLKGTIDGNGYLTLEEFDPQGKQTGVFKGIWQTNNDGMVAIAGNWTKPNGEKKTAFSLHQEPVEFSGGTEITSKTIKETNKKLKYEINAEYPQVAGASDNRFDKFNQEAKNLAAGEAAKFRKEMAEWAADQADQEDQEPSTLSSSLDIGYNISLATDNLISTQFNIGTYFQGAAHPNSNSRVLNYDFKAGKPIKLADLFKPGAKYLQTISVYSIKELKKQSQSKGRESMLNDEGIQSGAGPDPDNYKSWTITKKGLGITFDSYQVAPYAAGPQYVLVPYSALKDIIRPDGPLAPFVK